MNNEKLNNGNNLVAATVIALVGLALITYFLLPRDIYIKSLGQTAANGQAQNTINVSGDGKIFAKPDMAVINLTASELGASTRDAQDKVNQKINQALAVLKQNNINDNDIVTTDLSLYPQYDYSNGIQVFRGQRASQSLTVKIKKIDPKAAKVGAIIDGLAKIENLQLNGISFDLEDRTPIMAQAREQAYAQAQTKAEQLAKLGKVKLLKPLAITDTSVDYVPGPIYGLGGGSAMEAKAVSASVSSGQLQINLSLNVVFGIE